jgi:hypothetical protein
VPLMPVSLKRPVMAVPELKLPEESTVRPL